MIERIADRIVESLILSHTIEIEDVSVYQYALCFRSHFSQEALE